jgi:hypothetical protein
MKLCQVSVIFAYFSVIYISASIIYLVVSQSYGTPFKDAVNKYPELRQIKKESAEKRKKLFFTGVIVSIIGVFILNPFGKCF